MNLSQCPRLSPWTQALLQGQWISILIAGTGIFATILSQKNSNFPLLMSTCNYTLLATYLLRMWYFGRQNNNNTHESEIIVLENKPSYLWYVTAAIFDVEANFLVTMAYNYTTITSVMLLDCFTIPCAMILSYIFLGSRFTWKHYTGAVVCFTGLACIIINDSLHSSGKSKNPVLGDIFCLCGAVLYASSNVMQEHLVKFHGRNEFLGYLGAYGAVLAFVQCMIVDLPHMMKTDFTTEVVLSICGFVVCLFLMYVNTSSFLQQSDAILFNLSLLTSDVYAVLFTFLYDGYLVSWLYFVSFALVMVGLAVYHSERPPSPQVRDRGPSQDHKGGVEEEAGRGGSAERSYLSGLIPSESGNGKYQYNPINGEEVGSDRQDFN